MYTCTLWHVSHDHVTHVQVTVDPVVPLSSRTSEGSTLTSRHSKRVGGHGNTRTGGNHEHHRDDLMTKLKSLEQEHQRLLNSHNQTEVSCTLYYMYILVLYCIVYGSVEVHDIEIFMGDISLNKIP